MKITIYSTQGETDESAFALLVENVLDFDHVLLRNAFGNAHYKGNLGFYCVNYCVSCKWRGNIDHGRIRLKSVHCILNSIENRQSKMKRTTYDIKICENSNAFKTERMLTLSLELLRRPSLFRTKRIKILN